MCSSKTVPGLLSIPYAANPAAVGRPHDLPPVDDGAAGQAMAGQGFDSQACGQFPALGACAEVEGQQQAFPLQAALERQDRLRGIEEPDVALLQNRLLPPPCQK